MSAGGGKSKGHRRSLSHPVEPNSTVIQLPKPDLELHARPIKLNSACHDSPMFRKSLLKEEETVTELSAQLKSFAKSLRQMNSIGNQFSTSISTVTTEAQLLQRRTALPAEIPIDELELDKFFQTFIQTMQLGENLRADSMRQYEELGIKPIEALQDEIIAVKDSARKWQRASALSDACAIKVAGLKKNSNKLDESEAELAELKRQTEAAAIELGTGLNVFAAKRRLVVVDSMCRMLELQKSYLDQYQALVKECMPEMQAARARIVSSMDEIPQSVKRIPQKLLQMSSVSGYLQGYLYRKTKMNFTRRSYFVLEDGVLSCHENTESGEVKWKLHMLICTVKPSSEATRNFCFDIISPQKSRTLQADSQETMQKWITAIQESISAQLDKQRIGKPGRRGSNANGTKHSAVAAGCSSAEASEELAKKEAVIKELYECDDGNRKCADCFDANPTWISINLGVLICLECSGIHRSMGTHISKVRSLTLDSLAVETKLYLKALGNKSVNQVFGPDPLTAIPTSFGERLNPNSSRKDREAWIKAKYAEKIFVETYRGPNIHLDLAAAIRQQELSRCLLLYAQGANLQYRYESDCNRQPLHYAADGDNPLVLMFLLQNGAQVNVKDSSGLTPLHIAAQGHVASAAMLCRMRAKTEVADQTGKTPLDIAMDSQNADMITLLRLAKLAREGGGMDEKSFLEALDGFTADIQSRPNTSPSIPHSLPAPTSAPLVSRSLAIPVPVSSSRAASASSSSASPTLLSASPSRASPDQLASSASPSPSSKSSFSFLSKLDTKKR